MVMDRKIQLRNFSIFGQLPVSVVVIVVIIILGRLSRFG